MPSTVRRSVTAAASALAAAALVIAVAGRDCGEDAGPAETVRALAVATAAEDRHALIDLLGPKTRSRLATEARRATELSGGGKVYEPADLVTLGGADELGLPEEFSVRYEDERRAYVDVSRPNGPTAELLVVLHEDRWLVELEPYVNAP